jgi:hypothetical protein
MSDFFASIGPDAFGELATELAMRAKPAIQMSAIEAAEFRVLEAALKTEALKADLLYVRVTGEAPPA